jgi:transposase
MAPSRTRSVGRDVPKDASAVADVTQDHGAEVLYRGTLGTRQGAIDPLLRKRPSKAPQLVFVYAAGPWGSWLSRSLTQQDADGWVVAPARMPKQAGDRGKTDRRDAVHLARLARSGALPAVYVPQGAAEAMRDRSRARAETLGDCKDAKFRRTAFLLRHERRSPGRAHWSPAHRRGLSAVVGPTPAQHIVLQEDVRAVTAHPARLQRLAQALQAHVQSWRLRPVGAALPALRGVQCTVAVTMVADIGALRRFDTPRARRQFLGLLPAASSSGARRQQGAIPKAGNPHARRALGEGAWAYRDPAKGRRPLQLRLEQQPKMLQASRWQAQVRRCQRSRRLGAPGKPAHGVIVASAREVGGCMWASAQESPVTASGPKTEGPVSPSRRKFPEGIGRDAAPVWGNPRRRSETHRADARRA